MPLFQGCNQLCKSCHCCSQCHKSSNNKFRNFDCGLFSFLFRHLLLPPSLNLCIYYIIWLPICQCFLLFFLLFFNYSLIYLIVNVLFPFCISLRPFVGFASLSFRFTLFLSVYVKGKSSVLDSIDIKPPFSAVAGSFLCPALLLLSAACLDSANSADSTTISVVYTLCPSLFV